MVWGGMSQHHRTELVVIAGNLNPIEHVWDLLDRRVRARAIPPRNVRELSGALVEEWGNISQQKLPNLVQTMRRRCTAVLNASGGHTRY